MTTGTTTQRRTPLTEPGTAQRRSAGSGAENATGRTQHGLLVGLLNRPGGAPAALVTLPGGRRAVTAVLRGPQARQVEEAVAGRLRPPTTASGRQLVRWLERPLPAELSVAGPGPADIALTAVTAPAPAVDLAPDLMAA
ncbi:hypothetical protein [Kitasatospora sp. NPDC057223]|uniref:hypothetical protein n=1 Tax=Kitasatospora sp. NPDC057223 TaxID=3346055 RepID=UPI00363DCCA1